MCCEVACCLMATRRHFRSSDGLLPTGHFPQHAPSTVEDMPAVSFIPSHPRAAYDLRASTPASSSTRWPAALWTSAGVSLQLLSAAHKCPPTVGSTADRTCLTQQNLPRRSCSSRSRPRSQTPRPVLASRSSRRRRSRSISTAATSRSTWSRPRSSKLPLRRHRCCRLKFPRCVRPPMPPPSTTTLTEPKDPEQHTCLVKYTSVVDNVAFDYDLIARKLSKFTTDTMLNAIVVHGPRLRLRNILFKYAAQHQLYVLDDSASCISRIQPHKKRAPFFNQARHACASASAATSDEHHRRPRPPAAPRPLAFPPVLPPPPPKRSSSFVAAAHNRGKFHKQFDTTDAQTPSAAARARSPRHRSPSPTKHLPQKPCVQQPRHRSRIPPAVDAAAAEADRCPIVRDQTRRISTQLRTALQTSP